MMRHATEPMDLLLDPEDIDDGAVEASCVLGYLLLAVWPGSAIVAVLGALVAAWRARG